MDNRGNHTTAIAAITFLLLTLGVSSALADVQVYDLAAPNAALSGFTGPYEQVTVDLTSSTVIQR